MSTNPFPECNPATSQVKGFKDLPIEVISHIFEFLPFSYLQDARRVCQLWYAASHSPNLLKREVIVCVQRQGDVVSNTLRKSHKPVRNVCLKGNIHAYNSRREGQRLLHPEVSQELLWNDWVKSYDENFWICYGPKLRSLSFHFCGIIKDELLRILSLCPELKSFEMIGCRLESGILSFCPELKSIDTLESRPQDKTMSDELSPKLTQLESFTVDGTFSQYLDDKAKLFDSVVSSTTRLNSLNLINCMYERGIFGTSYVTPDHIIRFIQKNAHSIVNISFVHKVFQNELALTELLKIPDLQLKSLETNYPIPRELAHRLRSLRALKLRGSFRDELNAEIVSELESLKCLELKFCDCESLSNLASLKNLSSLSIGEVCMSLGREGVDANALLMKALCSEVNVTLKRLSLRLNDSLNVACALRTSTLIAIARTHPALTDFELDWPLLPSERNEEVAEEDVHLNYAIQAIFKYQVSLRSLRLTNLQDLTDSGLNGERLPSYLEENPTGNSLARLKHLWKLDLADVWAPYVSFENLVLPELRDLSFRRFCLPSENVDVFIKNHPRIERLTLHNGLFSDETINVIVSSLPRLKYAFIASREKISEESITKLRKHCNTDIGSCVSVMDYYWED